MPRLVISEPMWGANSSGVEVMIAAPKAAMRSRVSDKAITLSTAALIWSMTARGVPAGASRPTQAVDWKPG